MFKTIGRAQCWPRSSDCQVRKRKISADCKMNKKTTNIYFPVLVIIIFLVFVADQKSAMVNLPGKKKREVRKKRIYFYGD